MHYYHVIPFLHSIGTEPLVYTGEGCPGEEEIVIGSLVMIPYRSSIEMGIVSDIVLFDSHADPDAMAPVSYEIRAISSRVTHHALLDHTDLIMIEALATRYMIPIHRVLSLGLTRPIISRLEKKEFKQLSRSHNPELSHPREVQLHLVRDGIIRSDILESYLTPRTIYIFPDDFSMMPYRSWFDQIDALVLMAQSTPPRMAQGWIDLYNGSHEIVCGSRKLLFAELSMYTHIVYIEDTLGADYWHYPVRIPYWDILRLYIQTHPHMHVTVLSSIPTLQNLKTLTYSEVKHIS